MTGVLYGIGLGPGDPELVTVKAARLISTADVVAYHSARHGRSNARAAAAPYLRDDQLEELLVYPVTVEATDHPGGYRGALDDFYIEAAERLAGHLAAGRTVALLAAGDALFYSSYMHMHKRLSGRFRTEIVPGVTSVSAASAAMQTPLVEADEVLTVCPGTLPYPRLVAAFTGAQAIAVMKLGGHYPVVLDALRAAGRLDDAVYVERASTGAQRVLPAVDVDPATVPYFAVVLVPGPLNTAPADDAPGWVRVVGLGPGDPRWTTPEVTAVLTEATDLVGYRTYLARVTPRPGQTVHSSDNKVEAERAEFALDLARRGRRVAVVSSGDPGIFAMATAVLEAAEDPAHADVDVAVLPGVSAAQAVAARAGAPLGHDFAVVSLSDRLKPWDVVERRVRAALDADLVLAVYNPASRERREQVARLRDVVVERRGPQTPVVVGRDVGGPTESLTVTTAGELDVDAVDMRTLLLIGSTTTVVGRSVFTPRRYG